MKLDRWAAPVATYQYDIDRRVHITDMMGDAWCDTPGLVYDGHVDPDDLNPDTINWCEGCLASAKEEGLIIE